MNDKDLIVTIKSIKNATFIAKKVVDVHLPEGRGWGAREAACSDYTDMLLIEPADNGDWYQNIEELKKALARELEKENK